MTHDQLERRVRYLTMYAFGSTLVLLVGALAAFGPQQIAAWNEVRARTAQVDTLRAGHIKAHRLDIVEPDGKLDLVIANAKRIPGAIVKGEELIDHREGQGRPGMLFYNAEETEMGGIGFHSERSEDGSYQQGAQIAFDQYNQDQVVALRYGGTNKGNAAGLHVWDRPTSVTIEEVIEIMQIRRSANPDSADLAWAEDMLKKARRETASRVFVGSQNRNAGMHLRDTRGRERIRMVVDSLDRPQLVFLDKDGNVVKRFSPNE